jgi:hypothetical protein
LCFGDSSDFSGAYLVGIEKRATSPQLFAAIIAIIIQVIVNVNTRF